MQTDDKTVFVNFDKQSFDQPTEFRESERESGTDRLDKLNDLERVYMELGKAYYEGRFEDPLPELLPLFDKITEIKERGKRQKVQQDFVCPGCGESVEPDSVFCGFCGYKLK